MNEIKHIHLGRESFTISVAAYRELHEYLEAIKAQVGAKSGDVLEEVELRMAELLAERGVSGSKVIVEKDVAFLKEQLGEPHDFKDDDESGESASPENVRRLFRDPEHAMIAGVAAGLGAYFGIDAVIVRLLFVLLTFFGGSGVLIYIILWLIVPEAKTKSERLQMQGKAVTVESLKEVVNRADLPAAAERMGKAGKQFGNGAGRAAARVIELLAKTILTIIGVAFVAWASAIFLGAVALGTYGLTHGVALDKEIIFPVGNEAVADLMCAIVVALALAFLLLAAGLGVIRRKAIVRGWVIGAVAGLFLVAAGLGAVLAIDVVPAVHDKYESMRQTQMSVLPSFTNATLRGTNVNFNFVPDSKYAVELQYFGRHAQVAGVTERVSGDTLNIDTTGYKPDTCERLCFLNNKDLTVIIHAPNLQAASVQGTNAYLNLEGSDLAANQFTLTAAGDVQAFVRDAYAAKIQASVLRADGSQQVILQNVNAQAQNNFVQIGGGAMTLQQPGGVNVDTNQNTCAANSATVYLVTAPSALTVNGTAVTPATAGALAHQQSASGTNAFNCVTIQQPPSSDAVPITPPAPNND